MLLHNLNGRPNCVAVTYAYTRCLTRINITGMFWPHLITYVRCGVPTLWSGFGCASRESGIARPRADSHESLVGARFRKNMLDANKKKRIIEKFKTHATDTGSPQVQIAILTAEIKDLTEHLKSHKKDFSSRRGLIKKVGERRRLMKYLKREDAKAYDDLLSNLKI